MIKGDGYHPVTAFLPLLAYLLDLAVGDPDRVYQRIWHPVVVPGRLAALLEKRFNKQPTHKSSLITGTLCSLFLLTAMAALAALIHLMFRALPFGWIAELILASTLIAHTSLAGFVARVATALESGGLDGGRRAVQHLVSRKAEVLDESGVCRSAIESLAENFSDAVIAPLFWFTVGTVFDAGLVLLAAYKTLNTLDSMWGYRSDRYEYFGKSAARLDDVANWLPARLSACIVLVSAWRFDLFASVSGDAPKHRSPNAGWPEAAFAYVLGIRIAGPRVYDEQVYDGPWMGQGRETLTATDIKRAVGLFHSTVPVVSGLLGLCGLALWGLTLYMN